MTMPQVRAAMADGSSLPDAHPALRAFFDVVEPRPDWVDDDLLERGGAAARRIGKDGFDILAFGSLLGGYRSGGALQPLVRTGRFDRHPEPGRRDRCSGGWRALLPVGWPGTARAGGSRCTSG